MDESLNFEQLAQKISPGGRLLRVWTLHGGISAEMTGLEIAGADGKTSKWVARRVKEPASRNNSLSIEQEYLLLRRLHGLGLAVPAPVALDTSGEIFPEPYLVTAYIEGRPDFSLHPPGDFAAQMA